VKVEASTINPSDHLKIKGILFGVTLPAVMGIEGTGHVVEANGQEIQNWIGKRVSFMAVGSGSWGEFAVTSPDFAT